MVNTTVQELSIVVARILQRTVNITPESFVDVIRNSSDDILVMAVGKMQSAKNASQNAKNKISQVTSKFERTIRILDELHRTREEGENITTAVTKTVIVSPNKRQLLV